MGVYIRLNLSLTYIRWFDNYSFLCGLSIYS